MKLTSVAVTNFRSVEDSGSFSVDDITCLVGKNEAGKTAILQALAGLNPHPATPIAYNVERDYPRRHLTDYAERHDGEAAIVVTTTWEIDEAEYEQIATEFGPKVLTSREITVFRRYDAKAPEWQLQIDLKAAIDHLLSHERLDATERSPLGTATNTQTLITALEGLAERTDKQTKLLERLKGYPGHTITGKVQAILSPRLPTFMYFSHYDRMNGQVRVDQLKQWRDSKELEKPERAGDRVFLDFLSFAGTTLEEILEAKTYESLNARCEAASSKITRQVFEYWKQNRFLAIEVRVTKAEQNDPPPFNEGVIVRARVKNKVHEVTVPFSERSAGFIWFFSFLVKFAQVQKSQGDVVLLLDEPGLSLHGKAQADLLRYFAEKLQPKHQVLYSTHSPFMVAPDRLLSVRIVEDVVKEPSPQDFVSEGTKVREDVLAVGGNADPDSLFPLQGALGYEVSQSLFVGAHTLLVEGPSDILYLQALSNELKRRKRTALDPRWTLCPSGGIDKIQPFVSLFAGNKLHVAVLTDQGPNDKSKLERLKKSDVLRAGHVFSVADFAGKPEGDIEDLFEPELFISIVNAAYTLPKKHALTVTNLDAADKTTVRLVKKAEAAFRTFPESIPTYDHFTPAAWLIRNLEAIQGAEEPVSKTLDRAEAVFRDLNALLPKP